ncbi:MAG: Ig-like domain-containing protein [Oligoflexia bacterium]|nr:Ig-like domain-containing protein [Oligoflexia bacterium]
MKFKPGFRFLWRALACALIVGFAASPASAAMQPMYSNGEGPVISITPSAEVLPAGIVEFKVEASDPDGLGCANFSYPYIGRAMVDCELPFSFFVDTRRIPIPSGADRRNVTITVSDSKGNSTGVWYLFDLDPNVAGLPPLDTTPPVLRWVTPTIDTTTYGRMSGSYSYIPVDSGKVIASFNASDDTGVQRVELLLSICGRGKVLTKEAAPYSFELDAAKLYAEMPAGCTGGVSLLGYIWDKSGIWAGVSDSYSSSRTLVYDNHGDVTGPSLKILSPVDGSTLPSNRVLTIELEATDPAGVSSVVVSINSGTGGGCTFVAPPYTCTVTVPVPGPYYPYTGTLIAVSALDFYHNQTKAGVRLIDPAQTTDTSSPSGDTSYAKPGKGRKK